MAKFNKTNTIKTENCSGHAAYSMSKKERLMTAVVTTMFGEEKYYGSTDADCRDKRTPVPYSADSLRHN